MGALIEVDGFTDADDIEFDPIEIRVPWRNGDGKVQTETLWARPRIPFGVLMQIEVGDRRGSNALIDLALLKDDQDVVDGEPVEGTSSKERWEALTTDPDREIPGKAITGVLQGLFNEYNNRRAPTGAPARPTNSSGPSSGRQSRTGRSSTAGRRGKASTSARSMPTSD